MRGLLFQFGAAALFAAASSPVLAQQPPGCSDFKWSVDRELMAFAGNGLASVAAGTPITDAGKAVALKLGAQPDISFAVAPTHKPKHDPAYAGAFPLPTTLEPGSYQITLSSDAWIDVVQDGKLLKQTGFTGSHTCEVVRKSVRFSLDPGPATVEISDSPKDSVTLEILPTAVP